MAYLTIARFKALTIAPAVYVDEIEAVEAGWTAAQLDYWGRWTDSRLSKRYAVPFATPTPIAVEGWVARLVTERIYYKRGVDATDDQFARVIADAESAKTEIAEAANSHEGLFELPLREDTTTIGVSRGGPLAYTEVSPYTWTDVQYDEVT